MAPLSDATPTPAEAIVAALGITRAEAEAIHSQMIGDLDGDVIHLDEPKAAPEPPTAAPQSETP